MTYIIRLTISASFRPIDGAPTGIEFPPPMMTETRPRNQLEKYYNVLFS